MNKLRKAIISGDVCRYSYLMERDEENTQTATADSLQLCADYLSANVGDVFQIVGDNFMAAFDNPNDAVTHAIELQDKLIEKNLAVPIEKRIEFRMGIHFGEVSINNGKLFGGSLNIAARVQDLAPPLGVYISESTNSQLKHEPNLSIYCVGLFELKNINDPVYIYHVRKSDQLSVYHPRLSKDKLFQNEDVASDEESSLAILPFQYTQELEDSRYFIDGLVVDLVYELSKLDSIKVISTNSSFVYRGVENHLTKIGNSLGATHIITGNVTKSYDELRIKIQLNNVGSNKVIWEEEFDQQILLVIGKKSQLVENIKSKLKNDLSLSSHIESDEIHILSYGNLLRAQQLYRRYDKSTNKLSEEFLNRALKYDKDYSRAYSMLSRVKNLEWRYAWGKRKEEMLDEAVKFAELAVSLNKNNSRNLTELGFVYLYKKEHEASIEAYQTAYDLGLRDPDFLVQMGDALSHSGIKQDAIDLINQAVELNPLTPDWYFWNLAGAYYQNFEYEEALTAINKMGDSTEAERVRAASYAKLGMNKLAKQSTEKILRAYPNFSTREWADVQPDKNREDTENFIDGLRLAGLP